MKSNLDYNYTSPIDLAPNGIPFGANYIGKVKFESKVGLIEQDLCVCYSCYTQRNIYEILLNQTEIDYIYHFLIDLTPNGRPFGLK